TPGTVPIAVLATTPTGQPYSEKIEVRILPSAAARITLAPTVTKLVAGQRVNVDATVLTASGDEREGDAVTWTSTNPAVLRVADGVVTAMAPGSASLTARAGRASATLTAQDISANGLTVGISPARISARQGDVIRFAVDVRDSRGQRITGITPTWSFSPGHGSI